MNVVLLEGILVLFNSRVRSLLDMKIFVDLDSDLRLARRVVRDLALGRDLQGILSQYLRWVKPTFDDFIWPVCSQPQQSDPAS